MHNDLSTAIQFLMVAIESLDKVSNVIMAAGGTSEDEQRAIRKSLDDTMSKFRSLQNDLRQEGE